MKLMHKTLCIVAIVLCTAMVACQQQPVPQQTVSVPPTLPVASSTPEEVDWSATIHYREECKPFVEKCEEFHKIPKEWEVDSNLYTVRSGLGEEHVLEDYEPKRETPLFTKGKDEELKVLSSYETALPEGEVAVVCESCNEPMLHLDNVLYEQSSCGHGVFIKADYCEADDTLQVQQYYDRCGCYMRTYKAS